MIGDLAGCMLMNDWSLDGNGGGAAGGGGGGGGKVRKMTQTYICL